MRRLLILMISLFMGIQAGFAKSIDEIIDSAVAPVSDVFVKMIFYPVHIFGADIPIAILWILIGGAFFTFYFRGLAVWGFKHAFDLITKKPAKKANDDGTGEVSSLQALATALSGTVGLGSIAGIAIAISIGGPGAIFWLVVGSIFGMSLKFVEATLAVKYRKFNPDGSVSGGPMHYIAHGLTRKGLRWLGQPLAMVFAILLIPGSLGGGNMFQINQATQQMIAISGGENSIFFHNAWLFGLINAILVALIVIGGIKSIAKVTEKIVPFMCLLYIAIGLIILVYNFFNIPMAIWTIIKEAFVPQSIYGGVAGTIIIGFRRSVQSNEAGTGSAPIAYATVKTKEPISQGFVSLLEPFITACIGSLTALTIVVTGVYKGFNGGLTGVQITSKVYETIASWLPYVLGFVIILFAVSTVISWAYYGQKGWTYIFGEGKKRIILYQILFCVFIVLGSSINLQSIVDFTDAGIIAMSFPNMLAMYILMRDIKYDLRIYCKEHGVRTKFVEKFLK